MEEYIRKSQAIKAIAECEPPWVTAQATGKHRGCVNEKDGWIVGIKAAMHAVESIVADAENGQQGPPAALLSLEEAFEVEDPVYFESAGNACFWCNVVKYDRDRAEIQRFNAISMLMTACRYGKDWRCWSAKPTEEQRKKTEWR